MSAVDETRRKADSDQEGVSADDPLLKHYEEVGSAFLQGRGINVTKTAGELHDLFVRTIHDLYLVPILGRVKDAGVRTAAEHARRIGVNRSTTSAWWNLHSEEKLSRVGHPELKTVLFTLAAFGVDPGGMLPRGADVTVRAWQECIGYIEHEKLRLPRRREIAPDELLCLHLVWLSEEWKKERYSDAAEYILPTIKLFFEDSTIDTLPAIQHVVREWFIPSVIVLSLLKTKWLLE